MKQYKLYKLSKAKNNFKKWAMNIIEKCIYVFFYVNCKICA